MEGPSTPSLVMSPRMKIFITPVTNMVSQAYMSTAPMPFDVTKYGKAVVDCVRSGKGPAILQVHIYQFVAHSSADPEHERGRKKEKMWARIEQHNGINPDSSFS